MIDSIMELLIRLFNWLVANVLGIIVGGIITEVIVQIICNLLPINPQLRFRLSYLRKRLGKWFRNEKIRIEHILKASITEEASYAEKALSDEICRRLISRGFECLDKRPGTLKFTYQISESLVGVSLNFGYKDVEDEVQQVETVEAILSVTCKYRSFEADIIDLLQVVRKLESALRDILYPWHGEAIRCSLRHLYRFTGVLSSFKMSHLWGMVEEKYKIDLFEGGLIIYAPLSKEIATILKRIITFYY